MRVRAEGSLVGLLGDRPAGGRAAHPYARLAVEVVARGRRGSGYLVGEDTVLTAAQPVRRASRIVVHLDTGQPGSREVLAAVVWLDVDADLAVLRLTPGAAAPAPPAPTRYARMTSRPASLDVSTSLGAEVETVVGSSSDTFDIAAEARPGAVAFAGGLAVGVVTARDRYTVARLDHHLGHARSGRRLAALLEAGPLVDVA
jgi:S1-C subfamily serine protease